MLTVGSLFTGIAGTELGISKVTNIEMKWSSEIDTDARKAIRYHHPSVLQLGDIQLIDFSLLKPVDMIVGGFPCTDISSLGPGKGIYGKDSRLWFAMERAIRQTRPKVVFVENVQQLIKRGFDVVLGNLADLGYNAIWGMFSSAQIGAPHRRRRIFILATLPSATDACRKAKMLTSRPEEASYSGDGLEIWRGGIHEEAITRWAERIGAPPKTTVLSRNGNKIPNPDFAGWMMGFPKGWLDIPGERKFSVDSKWKLFKNSVQPQTTSLAWSTLTEALAERATAEPSQQLTLPTHRLRSQSDQYIQNQQHEPQDSAQGPQVDGSHPEARVR